MTNSEVRGDVRPPDVEGDERTTLLAFLRYLREAVVAKTYGAPEEALRTPGVPSGTSVLGLLKHLTEVERGWFAWAYAGEDIAVAEDDALTPRDTVDSLVAAYRAAAAHSDAIVVTCDDLERPGARSLRETAAPSMRWILVHMIEETARHAGHADILRERIDGAVGR
ncbi:DinB family protein [Streptomyces sp.]|uniref:DinB family protein n=1 Tax=Streptomyces sp. TaxID=1931 RepID=UPI002811DF26|nr:DinB family protein [Streptomyces sp.]